MTALKVDPTFRDLIPPLSDAEFIQLEKNIVGDGRVNEPLTVWDGTIIDGHHRWKIIQKHPEIPYTVEERVFKDKWAAISWACNKQLGRRNSTPEQQAYLIGKRYEAEKMIHGGDRGNQYTVPKGPKGHLPNDSTRKRIADEYGVGEKVVRNAASFAKGLDAADKVSPGFKDAVLTGSIKAPKTTIATIGKLVEPEQKKAVEAIQSGETVRIEGGKIKSNNSAINEFLAQNGSDVPYDSDDLKMELDAVVRTFRNNFSSTITIHDFMLQDPVVLAKIEAALSEAEAAIKEIRSLIR